MAKKVGSYWINWKTNMTTLSLNKVDQQWVSHFKTIFQGPSGDDPLPQNTAETGILDRDISDEELKLEAYILRNEKVPGHDTISNEMLSCL